MFFIFSLVLFGCSKSDEEDVVDKETYLSLSIKMSSDIGRAIEGNIFLFKLDGKFLKDTIPYHIYRDDYEYEGSYFVLFDVNNEYLYPDKYYSFKSYKDEKTGKYVNEARKLLSFGGSNVLKNGIYLVVLDLDNTPYSFSYKVIDTNKSKSIEKIFKTDVKQGSYPQVW